VIFTSRLVGALLTNLFAACSGLRQSLKAAEETRTQLESELNAAKLKNGKLLVKVKTVTKELETLKKKRPSPDSFDDLDRALQEEMNNQVAKVRISIKNISSFFLAQSPNKR
jgi:hypothetical protein